LVLAKIVRNTDRDRADVAAIAGGPGLDAAPGTSIMRFARLRGDDRAFWFLGPASYVKHESNLPMAMAVTWRLDHPLPCDLFAQFAAAVA
jgi:hypothetical protein